MLLTWFIIGLLRWFQREDLQFAIWADRMCLSSEIRGAYPDREFYNISLDKLGLLHWNWNFLRRFYLYYNDSIYLSTLFCQK